MLVARSGVCRACAFAGAGLVFLWTVLAVSAFGQAGAPAPQSASEAGVPVIYRGQEIVRIHRGLGGMAPAERARIASERLHQFVRDPSFDPTRVTVTHSETVSELVYDDRVLAVISDEDARAVGRPRAELAQQVRDRLVDVVTGIERSSASGRSPLASRGPRWQPPSWGPCCGGWRGLAPASRHVSTCRSKN